MLKEQEAQEKANIAIACSFIVNKLHATDSSISPGLINKVDSTDLHFRSVVQVHSYGSSPQSTPPLIPNNIRPDKTDPSVATGTKSTNAIKYSCFHG